MMRVVVVASAPGARWTVHCGDCGRQLLGTVDNWRHAAPRWYRCPGCANQHDADQRSLARRQQVGR